MPGSSHTGGRAASSGFRPDRSSLSGGIVYSAGANRHFSSQSGSRPAWVSKGDVPAREEIQERIVRILRETLSVVPPNASLDSETALLGKGLGLDSSSTLELIVAIEDEFGVYLDERDLTPQAFETLGSLVSFVEARLSA